MLYKGGGDAVRVASPLAAPQLPPPPLLPSPLAALRGVGGGGGGGKLPLPAEVSTEVEEEIEVDLREVYFLIMHFLRSGPCERATGQLWNELLQHKLLPRRYHGFFSRNGSAAADENDDGVSFPLSYAQVAERYKHIDSNHLVKLLQQLLVHDKSASLLDAKVPKQLTAAEVPTLLGSGAFSLLETEQSAAPTVSMKRLEQMRWPHWQADQVHALAFRELGGGFAKHHRAPSTRTVKHVIIKPSVLVNRIRIIQVLRGHRNAVYCAVFDRSGRYLVTGSDDRLVKIWSVESRLCLRSCRGHEGDITDLSVSSANNLVASASNDSSIRVWGLPDGAPVAVLRGHTAGVTAIRFSPRPGCEHHLLSSSDDGTCRIWDARDSSVNSRVYMPKPDANPESAGAENRTQAKNQIQCCAFNADGSYFVTGSSDNLARVWDARKWADEYTGRPNYEHDILSGHENVVNYVQFSGCAEPIKISPVDFYKDDNVPDNLPKFKTTWFPQDSIVTCSRDGTAIIWSPRPRKQLKLGRWVKAYHLKVPPPPMPQPAVRTGGPRQRLPETPRGVNMIVWSLDNRFVLAAIMDCRICVWNAVDGSLVHCLTGHTKQTYVLNVHPCNPRIAMSAGYDGRVIIWDIWEGRPVRTFETADYNLVDANFSPDGTSLVVSDEVGQVYLFSTGAPSEDDDAKYDQFFLGDYRPLIRDTHGNVLDQETQLPPHQRNLQDLLCDSSLIPYPEPYQSSYQQRRLGLLGCYWQPPSVQLAVGTFDDPAFVPQDQPQAVAVALQENEQRNEQGIRWVEQPADGDAMDLDDEATGFSDDSGSDYRASEESSSEEDAVEESGTIFDSDSSDEEDDDLDSDVRTRRNGKKILASLVRNRKRRRVEESNSALVIHDGDAHRLRSRKRVRKSSSDHALRPMRVAARNALTMFSSLHELEEDEARRLAADPDRPGTSAENESQRLLRNGKVLAGELKKEEEQEEDDDEPPKRIPVETTDVGECRRPRSQRKLVLKLRNCVQGERTPVPHGVESSGHDASKAAEGNGNHPKGADDFIMDENAPTEGISSGEKKQGGFVWKKAKAAKRARLSSSSSSEEDGKADGVCASSGDEIAAATKAENGNQKVMARAIISESESERSLSANYLAEEKRKEQDQALASNDSAQNGEAPEGDNDPDYHEEASPGSPEETDKADEEEQGSDDGLETARKMNTAVYSRRRKPRKVVTEAESYEDEDDEDDDDHPSGGRRRSTRLAQSRVVSLSKRRSTRSRRNISRPRWEASSSCDMDDDSDWDRSSGDGGRRRSERRTSTRLKVKPQKSVRSRFKDFHVKRSQNTVHRNPGNVSWLLLTEVERTRYIPQLGDEVVYFVQGHNGYLEHRQPDGDNPRVLKKKTPAVEFCTVTGLRYVVQEESGNTCCELTLKFTGGSINRGSSLSITLPELTDFPDFIVERSRYDASMRRKWSSRDRCQVWWRSDDEEGGRWWEGVVTQVKAKSAEHPNSPWDSVGVLYKDEPSATSHCPWELHDIENPLIVEPPQIEEEKLHELLDVAEEVLHSNQSKDEYGLWRLQQAVSKPDFLDKIALPITMEVIRERLENKYYRSLLAVSHDLRILIDNFRTYFGEQHSAVLKVERLRNRFADALEDVSL